MPVSPGVRKALHLATRESLRLGHGYVGTEHLLLGLFESGDEPTVGILTGLGASKDGVEDVDPQRPRDVAELARLTASGPRPTDLGTVGA